MKYMYIIVILIIPGIVPAETLWQLGAGIGNITANSYPGSDQTQSITSPIPYIKIKTEWFDLDREGLHTNWFKDTNFRLDFSFDIGLPVDSDENELRVGMPDLDPVAHVGPLLIYQLVESENIKWQLQLPLTYAYALDDLDVSSTGWVANPRVYFSYLIGKYETPLHINASLGSVYGSEDFHQYYYAVDVADVTSSRSEYLAKEGLAGYRFNLSVTRRMNGYWLGLYLRYQNLDAAVFADSPLVNQTDYWFMGIGASWVFSDNM